MPRRLLLLLIRETLALLLEPRAVVALVGNARPAVELEDPAGDVVEEIPVMGHRDDAPWVLGEVALEPTDRFGVEVIRRLVEEEQIRLREKESAERDTATLAAGERAHVLVARGTTERVHRDVHDRVEIPEALRFDLVLRALEGVGGLRHLVGGQVLRQLHRELVVSIQDRPLWRNAGLDVATDVFQRIERRLLGEQSRAIALGDAGVADEVAVDASHDAQKRALARPIRTEHADLRVGVEGERDAAQDLALGRRHDLLELIHRVDELGRHPKTVAGRLFPSQGRSGERRQT